MDRYYVLVINVFLIVFICFYSIPVQASLPLIGKVIVVDVGHGFLDPGCVYEDIYEKDIVLNIGLYLERELSSLGATVILTRDSDEDLSGGVTNNRKKADFDKRISIINDERVDMYLSIHLNFLSDSSYYGAQVFYNNDNDDLAKTLQEYLNEHTDSKRSIKEIPSNTYMYKRLTTKGVLIECGFLSNEMERELLITTSYQQKLANIIALGVVKYYN